MTTYYVSADVTHGTGTGDDTDYLRTILASAATLGTVTVVIQDGTWMIDATTWGLNIPSGMHLVIRPDATLQAIPNAAERGAVLTIANAQDVTIDGGGTILGERRNHDGTTGEWGMGIAVLNSDRVTIDELAIADCWGDSIYVGGDYFGVTGGPCRNVVVANCTLSGSRRQGISVTMAEGIRIRDCLITDINGTNPQYGIDIETNWDDRPVRDVYVDRCTFRGSTGGAILVGRDAERVRITDCDFDGDRVSLAYATDARVSGSTFRGTYFRAFASHRVAVTDSTFESSGYYAGRWLGSSTDLSLTGCTFTNVDGDTSRRAIQVAGDEYDLDGFNVAGNTVRGYTDRSIITRPGVKGLRVTDNDFISDVPVHAPVAQLRADDAIINGNTFTAAAGPSSGGLVRINAARGLVAGNTFTAGSNPSGLLTLNNVPGAAGATVTVNRFDAPDGDAIRVTGETEYSVYGNDEHIGATT